MGGTPLPLSTQLAAVLQSLAASRNPDRSFAEAPLLVTLSHLIGEVRNLEQSAPDHFPARCPLSALQCNEQRIAYIGIAAAASNDRCKAADRLVEQQEVVDNLLKEVDLRGGGILRWCIKYHCVLFSAASRANRTVQLTVDAALRYQVRLEQDLPELDRLGGKFAEQPFLDALTRIANSEQWRRDDLADELGQPPGAGRANPPSNHTDTTG